MRRNGVTHLAGWLFADLLLILVLVVLGGQATLARDVGPEPTPTATSATPSPTATATRTPTPTPTPTPPPQIGMVPESIDLPLLVDQGVADDLVNGTTAQKAAAARRVNEAVGKALDGRQQRGAMVFVWGSDGGCGSCKSAPDASSAFAKAAADAIRQGGHRILPAEAGFYRSYMDLDAASGTLRLELFVYNS